MKRIVALTAAAGSAFLVSSIALAFSSEHPLVSTVHRMAATGPVRSAPVLTRPQPAPRAVAKAAMQVDDHASEHVADSVIAEQRQHLMEHLHATGFGPQSPRDIDAIAGTNPTRFDVAPAYTEMNLCNIHFHENAEHKGGEFTTYAGNGDGHGYGTGYAYDGTLSAAELAPIDHKIGATEHGDLQPGDTIEVHYVFSTADVSPGPTLGACLEEGAPAPLLRVEAQVYVLVNDATALDFVALEKVGMRDGLYQALNIPANTGTPVQYAGSTTGPGFNEEGSPFQVSWSVRPKVAKVDIETVGIWLQDNQFDEDHAHGVRNLVIAPELLSQISQ